MLSPIRFIFVGLVASASVAHAGAPSKAEDCGYQSQVVAAIQAARLERVKEAKVAEHIAATNPEWPERYNKAISILSGPIYDLKRRDLKLVDLGTQWKDTCLAQ